MPNTTAKRSITGFDSKNRARRLPAYLAVFLLFSSALVFWSSPAQAERFGTAVAVSGGYDQTYTQATGNATAGASAANVGAQVRVSGGTGTRASAGGVVSFSSGADAVRRATNTMFTPNIGSFRVAVG